MQKMKWGNLVRKDNACEGGDTAKLFSIGLKMKIRMQSLSKIHL